MKNSFIFDGMNSSDFGVWISGTETYTAPERDVEYVSVPGRNGDLIIDNGRWRNVPLTYPAYIDSDFPDKADRFKNMMCRKTGYRTLEDSYHPDEYRMAQFTGGFDPQTGQFNRNASFDINFNCKPQRFLKSGTLPAQFLLPIFSGNHFYTSRIPVESNSLTFTAHCPSGETFTVKVSTYDSSYNEQTSQSFTCSDGDRHTVTAGNTDAYWSIDVSNYTSADTVSLTVQTVSSYNGNPVSINAELGRHQIMTNPTGYYSKPLFEVFSNAIFTFKISNYSDGVREEYYDMQVNEINNCSHFWIDCELEYLYDDNRVNLTNYLRITTAQSDVGKSLVFPQLGKDVVMEMQNTTGGMNLVNVYPRWWRL